MLSTQAYTYISGEQGDTNRNVEGEKSMRQKRKEAIKCFQRLQLSQSRPKGLDRKEIKYQRAKLYKMTKEEARSLVSSKMT